MTEKITLVVPSHPKYLRVIRGTLQPVVAEAGFSEAEARKIILAVDEACSNIIKYAYEGDYTKTITLNLRSNPEKLIIELKDSGKKPDVSRIAPRKLDDVRPGGLGTYFIASVFDVVEYNTDNETGTVLTLMKMKQEQHS